MLSRTSRFAHIRSPTIHPNCNKACEYYRYLPKPTESTEEPKTPKRKAGAGEEETTTARDVTEVDDGEPPTPKKKKKTTKVAEEAELPTDNEETASEAEENESEYSNGEDDDDEDTKKKKKKMPTRSAAKAKKKKKTKETPTTEYVLAALKDSTRVNEDENTIARWRAEHAHLLAVKIDPAVFIDFAWDPQMWLRCKAQLVPPHK
jgi:hypothetical protein